MSTISATQAKAEFTSFLADVYRDELPSTQFLKQFFPAMQAYVKYLSIQVEHDLELRASDIRRGNPANTNIFSIQTEKVFLPPYYAEQFNVTEMDLYDRLFGSTAIDAGVYKEFISQVSRNLNRLRNKIMRAEEFQCSEVLETGIVSLQNGVSIDYKRDAESLVDLGADGYWGIGGVNPFETFIRAAKYLRQVGKSPDVIYNVLLGEKAMSDLYANDLFKSEVFQNLNNNINQLLMPTAGKEGSAFHGELSAGSYRFRLMTYPQYFQTDATTFVPYLNTRKIVVIPANPRFKFGYAAVPQTLMNYQGGGINGQFTEIDTVAQAYVVDHYPMLQNDAHFIRIKSAGLAIPTAVRQIWTGTVSAPEE